jgi:hypothetical protein
MEHLPAEVSTQTTYLSFDQYERVHFSSKIFHVILSHLTLSDWKCLRQTSRTIYTRLSSISTYSYLHRIYIVPKSSAGVSILENLMSIRGIDHLLLSNFDATQLQQFLQASDTFRAFLGQLTSLSFARSTTLIDTRLFYNILVHCTILDKLDLTDYKFFFLSHNFTQNHRIFPRIQRLNLNGNTHLSDYAFNRLMITFPNVNSLHLLNIPLRSSFNIEENRTLLTFENFLVYFQMFYERYQALTISFDPLLPCDTQVKQLFAHMPVHMTYFHIDGSLTIATLLHLLLLFDNRLQTLIVGRLLFDHTGCQPLFAAINQYAYHLRQLCIFLSPSMNSHVSPRGEIIFPGKTRCSSSNMRYLSSKMFIDEFLLLFSCSAVVDNIFSLSKKSH